MFHFGQWWRIPIFSTKRYDEFRNQRLVRLGQSSKQKLTGSDASLHSAVVSSCVDTLRRVINQVPHRHNSLRVNPNRRSASILLMDKLSMRELNLKHNAKNRPTDSICFPSVFSPLDIERDGDLMMDGCRAVHSAMARSSPCSDDRQPYCSDRTGDVPFNVWKDPKNTFEEDVGIVALCPAFILQQCASAIGTSRLSLGIPVRNSTDLPIASQIRSRCVAIHAGLHLLGYTHEEGTVHDDVREAELMRTLEKRLYRRLFVGSF